MIHLHSNVLKDYYRTTDIRWGVLAWYPFPEGSTVLDRTNGFLTGWLEKCGCSLIADKYEYAVIFEPEDYSVSTLMEYGKILKNDGKLILIFENLFGLQYFAGKRNHVSGIPFDFKKGMSRVEIKQVLQQAGFPKQKWYYPFPNHYFTKEVYSDNYMPNEFLNHRPSDYLEDDYTKVFDERLLWREVIRNNAFAFLASAYFVEAVKDERIPFCDVDYAAITICRKPDRAFATTIHNNGTVKKTALYETGVERLRRMRESHKYLNNAGIKCVRLEFNEKSLIMEKLPFPTLWDWQTQKIWEKKLKKEQIFAQFDALREAIYKAASIDGRVYWELVQANCFYDEPNDELIFFDQEFYWENIDPDVALVRALWQLMWSDGSECFEVQKIWLEELKERYALSDKWDNLIQIARDKTHDYVFNPQENLAIDISIQRALQRVQKHRIEAELEEKKFRRYVKAAQRIKTMQKKNVALYGNGIRGRRMYDALLMENIEVTAVFDRDIEGAIQSEAEAIIVTPLLEGDSIAKLLRCSSKADIYILEDLL